MSSHPTARKDVLDQVSEPSITNDDSPEDSIPAKEHARGQTQKSFVERDRYQVTIDILPDDILLCIFYVYVNSSQKREEWQTLVHVCQRWRTLVFGSPHHLNVHLYCSIKTPVSTLLDVWPALPIVVCENDFQNHKLDNLVAAFEHNDRICKIDLNSFRGDRNVLSAMKVPFPALTNLKLTMCQYLGIAPDLPDLLLGRSAPRLQHLKLDGFEFLGLPGLLSSTTGLVSLELRRIHPSWYISPEAIVTHLSALTCLESVTLGFEYGQSHPDRLSPPPTRTLIPALTQLKFEGANEYAEDLVARLDTPRLNNLDMTFFNETALDVSHLSQFISHHAPKFQAPDKAIVAFSDEHIIATLFFPAPACERLVLGILCDASPGQLLSLIRICRPFLPALAMVERLYIRQYGYDWQQYWKHGIRQSLWLQLLHLFPDAKDLYISSEITTYIVPVLKELVGERTAEVLPALQKIFFHEYEELSGPTSIEDFVAARELSGHPITVSRWFGH